MKLRVSLRDLFVALAAVLVASLLIVSYVAKTAEATHMPADKIAAAGSTLESIAVNGSEVLLREQMKVASPTDLILSLTAECSILTNVATTGNGTSEASGSVAMQILIDGNPVPVQDSTFGTPQGDDTGEVVFCDRLHRQTTRAFDDEDAELAQYQETRAANAFNWVSINPARYDENSDNILNIEVVGHFTTNAISEAGSEAAFAEAFVGNRTLVVEPVKLAVHENVAPTDENTPDE